MLSFIFRAKATYRCQELTFIHFWLFTHIATVTIATLCVNVSSPSPRVHFHVCHSFSVDRREENVTKVKVIFFPPIVPQPHCSPKYKKKNHHIKVQLLIVISYLLFCLLVTVFSKQLPVCVHHSPSAHMDNERTHQGYAFNHVKTPTKKFNLSDDMSAQATVPQVCPCWTLQHWCRFCWVSTSLRCETSGRKWTSDCTPTHPQPGLRVAQRPADPMENTMTLPKTNTHTHTHRLDNSLWTLNKGSHYSLCGYSTAHCPMRYRQGGVEVNPPSWSTGLRQTSTGLEQTHTLRHHHFPQLPHHCPQATFRPMSRARFHQMKHWLISVRLSRERPQWLRSCWICCAWSAHIKAKSDVLA